MVHLGETNSSVTMCSLVSGSVHLNPKPVECNPRCRGDGGQTLPGCTWAGREFEEPTVQVLKLFGVGVTLEVRFHQKGTSWIQSMYRVPCVVRGP